MALYLDKPLELKEKLKNDLKSNDNDINDFEKLINKKYEDYKIGEEKLLSKPNPPILPNEPIDVEDLMKKIDAKIAELEKEEEEEKIKIDELGSDDLSNDDIKDFLKIANEINEEISKEEIEKPKINIDVDSIVVDNNNVDDDFFDDFFGDE